MPRLAKDPKATATNIKFTANGSAQVISGPAAAGGIITITVGLSQGPTSTVFTPSRSIPRHRGSKLFRKSLRKSPAHVGRAHGRDRNPRSPSSRCSACSTWPSTRRPSSHYDKARTLANLKMEEAKSMPFVDVKDNFPVNTSTPDTATGYYDSGFISESWAGER